MKTRVSAFYYCEFCGHRHDAELDKMRNHITNIRAKGLVAYLRAQGKSRVLHVYKSK